MSESQIELLVVVSIIKKHLRKIPSLQLRNNCIKSIMKDFDCGLARASQIFADTPVTD
jgi:hypothetical protein